MLVQMQWQLIPETTMYAFNINTLLTMIVINKLTDRTQKKSRKWPETDTIFSPQCKNDQSGSKNTHAAVPEKLTINFFWPNGPIYMKSFQLNKMTWQFCVKRKLLLFSQWYSFQYLRFFTSHSTHFFWI